MNKFIITLSLTFSILFSVFLPINEVKAQAPSIPIGGRLLFYIPCTCSGGFLMYIFDYFTKTTLPILYQPGISLYDTPQNSSGLFTPGTHQLGTYIPGGACAINTGPACVGIPTIGTYNPTLPGFGNSLLPI